MNRTRIRLIHWHASEAEERAASIRSGGYEVDCAVFDPAALKCLAKEPPSAVVIDLTRLPSQGRDVAIAVRMSRSTRHVPLILVEGTADKVARVKEILPDAVYTNWNRIAGSLRQAIAHPPAEPVVPQSILAGYSRTPLVRKLGIKPHSTIVLIGAPNDFEKTLGELPEGILLRRQNRGNRNLTIWFTRSRSELERRIDRMTSHAEMGQLWIAWPKKASASATDLTQNEVRRIGLAAGLVDYKVCAIDATWSGLRFTSRAKDGSRD